MMSYELCIKNYVAMIEALNVLITDHLTVPISTGGQNSNLKICYK